MTTIALLLCFSLFSCEDQTDREAISALIEESAEERLNAFRKLRMQRCRMDVLDEAGRLADSILVEEARLRRDTMLKPPKPHKPEKPQIKTLLDSTPIKPFLTNELSDSTSTPDSLKQ